jgi:hypothetical protein
MYDQKSGSGPSSSHSLSSGTSERRKPDQFGESPEEKAAKKKTQTQRRQSMFITPNLIHKHSANSNYLNANIYMPNSMLPRVGAHLSQRVLDLVDEEKLSTSSVEVTSLDYASKTPPIAAPERQYEDIEKLNQKHIAQLNRQAKTFLNQT